MDKERRRRIVMHCDVNAFYPSCEQHRNPEFIRRPLIVGADPKRGRGRGVVTSCSYEARKFGVRSGMPISQAYKLCREGIFVVPDFELYGETSRRVMNLLRSYASIFEQTSIDEAFMDVTSKCQSFDDAELAALDMKRAIGRQEGLKMSVGIAPNKSIAKIASDFQKPDGLTIVTLDEVESFLNPLPVEKISGVGKKTTEFLLSKGIKTIGELGQVPSQNLTEWFGKGGVWLWAIASGIEETPVEERGLRKSISVEQTFNADVRDKKLVVSALDALSREVHDRLREEGLLFRTVGIKVRFEGFQTFTREKSHTSYTDDPGLVRDYVRFLFHEFETNPRKVRLVGARLSNLKEGMGNQAKLLEENSSEIPTDESRPITGLVEKSMRPHPRWKGTLESGGWGDYKCRMCDYAGDMVYMENYACFVHRNKLLEGLPSDQASGPE